MERPDKTAEEKALRLDISNLSEGTRDKYSQLLIKEQVSEAKKNEGKPVAISVEQRRALLEQAKQEGTSIESPSKTEANAQVPSSHKTVVYREEPYWVR
jgi:hypothetical protein